MTTQRLLEIEEDRDIHKRGTASVNAINDFAHGRGPGPSAHGGWDIDFDGKPKSAWNKAWAVQAAEECREELREHYKNYNIPPSRQPSPQPDAYWFGLTMSRLDVLRTERLRQRRRTLNDGTRESASQVVSRMREQDKHKKKSNRHRGRRTTVSIVIVSRAMSLITGYALA